MGAGGFTAPFDEGSGMTFDAPARVLGPSLIGFSEEPSRYPTVQGASVGWLVNHENPYASEPEVSLDRNRNRTGASSPALTKRKSLPRASDNASRLQAPPSTSPATATRAPVRLLRGPRAHARRSPGRTTFRSKPIIESPSAL